MFDLYCLVLCSLLVGVSVGHVGFFYGGHKVRKGELGRDGGGGSPTRKNQKANGRHSDMNFSPLALPCSRVPMVQGKVY